MRFFNSTVLSNVAKMYGVRGVIKTKEAGRTLSFTEKTIRTEDTESHGQKIPELRALSRMKKNYP